MTAESYRLNHDPVRRGPLRRMTVVRKYPLPFAVLLSLIIGGILRWGLGLQQAADWLWFLTLAVAGAPVIYETAKAIRRKHFASDIVASLAILAALALNDAFPGVIIVLMQTGGRALEDYAYRHASSSLEALLSRSPRVAHLRRSDGAATLVDIDVAKIQIGDALLVRPGDIVPVDGTVSSDVVAQIDESSLTGEPLPKSKGSGDQVFSGTINVGAAFEMKAEATSGKSQYAQIVDMVRKAQQEKAPLQRLADRYAIWFTPITIAMAAFGWALTRDVQTLLAVLVVATPCSLIFATPVAIVSGINKAARRGIIVKHGAAVEQIGKAQVVAFDKTGTITYGTPEVEQVVCLDSLSENDLVYRAASLEQFSSHPVAQTIANLGRQRFHELAVPQNFREVAGIGVEGSVEGENVAVGSSKILPAAAGSDLQALSVIQELSKSSKGKMLAFIAVNQKAKGVVVLGDRIREGVASMVADLASLGVKKTVMLTGDNRENAEAIAQQAGLSDLEANLLPQDKVGVVKALKERYQKVVMVGDGINDAPALASATVGIAMGAKGTAISAEAADIVLLVDDIGKVSETIRIGRKTIEIAKQSIFIGLGGSVILMVIASFGLIPPAIGALLQEALDVGVILNALRAR